MCVQEGWGLDLRLIILHLNRFIIQSQGIQWRQYLSGRGTLRKISVPFSDLKSSKFWKGTFFEY